MPAVGDVRNRLLSLADPSVAGNPDVYRLLSFRFPPDAERDELVARLDRMSRGDDSLVREIREPLCVTLRSHLGYFLDAMPAGFDLRGASVGNLVLTGGYLHAGRRLEPALELFSTLVEARGVVRPVVEDDLHMLAQLEDGRRIVGQHRITGKTIRPIDAPVRDVHLVRSTSRPTPVEPRITDSVRELIRSSELVCYPVGSFYSSVVANLLPAGVSEAISEADAPKIYVPNPGHDPEELGLDLVGKVERLVDYLGRGAPADTRVDRLLNVVLIDSSRISITPSTRRSIERHRIRVIDTQLATTERGPFYDDALLTEALLSLV